MHTIETADTIETARAAHRTALLAVVAAEQEHHDARSAFVTAGEPYDQRSALEQAAQQLRQAMQGLEAAAGYLLAVDPQSAYKAARRAYEHAAAQIPCPTETDAASWSSAYHRAYFAAHLAAFNITFNPAHAHEIARQARADYEQRRADQFQTELAALINPPRPEAIDL